MQTFNQLSPPLSSSSSGRLHLTWTESEHEGKFLIMKYWEKDTRGKTDSFYLFFVLIFSGHDRQELVSEYVNVVRGAQPDSSRSLHLVEGEGESQPWHRNLTTNIIVKLNYLRGLPLLPQLFPSKFPLKWTILSLPWGKTTS